jgi:cytochrome c oxidase subunit 4
MSTHQEPNYMKIFLALTVLTILEVAVVFLPMNKLLIGIMLVFMALAKAALVALYFMHLRFEKFALGIVALTPLIICVLLIFALLPDMVGSPYPKAEKVANSSDNEMILNQ